MGAVKKIKIPLRPTILQWTWTNRPIHLFLVGHLNPWLQETNVRVSSPQPLHWMLWTYSPNPNFCLLLHQGTSRRITSHWLSRMPLLSPITHEITTRSLRVVKPSRHYTIANAPLALGATSDNVPLAGFSPLIAHPHLLVWATNEQWVLALVTANGSHWLNYSLKWPLMVGIDRFDGSPHK